MFNDTIEFAATDLNRTINVGWSRQHIAGYEKTFDKNGNLYGLTVYTSISVVDKASNITSSKTFFLTGSDAIEFCEWFHTSY